MRAAVWLLVGSVLVLCVSSAAIAGDLVAPGELKVDPPTLRCLGFRWLIEGDDNVNARVDVEYRKKGDAEWRPALPLLRIHHEITDRKGHKRGEYRCGNLFAGSVLYLTPDTEYEVRFRMNDPDGRKAEETRTVRTRPVPRAAADGRTLHVYPPEHAGQKAKPAFSGIAEAEKAVQPGDIVLIHAGVHKGNYRLEKSGAEQKPIVYRGAGDGEAVIDGGNKVLFDLRGTDHRFFERLTIRNAKLAFQATAASGMVIRRCHIYDIGNCTVTRSPKAKNWYIADNVITGRNTGWYPRSKKQPSYGGVDIFGQGHVICYNRVSRFWDCLTVYDYSHPLPGEPMCMCIDMYGNDLFDAVDDHVETDYGVHNIRVFDNRLTNATSGLSTQPIYGGPCYLIRNHVYNITGSTLKLNLVPAGLLIYHNTCVSSQIGFHSSSKWKNGHLRNNLFLGAGPRMVKTGTRGDRSTLDYNGYRKVPNPENLFIRWGGKNYPTLAAFTRRWKYEKHGILVDFDDFVNARVPVKGHTYKPDEVDLRPKNGARPVNAGCVLPNVNDGYVGKAPDIGCYEYGRPAPHYGPRSRD